MSTPYASLPTSASPTAEDDAREHRTAAVRSHRPGHVHVGGVRRGHVLAAPSPSGEASPTR